MITNYPKYPLYQKKYPYSLFIGDKLTTSYSRSSIRDKVNAAIPRNSYRYNSNRLYFNTKEERDLIRLILA